MGARRALLIGSQTGGLTGVHDDVEVMADVLGGAGFEVRSIIEQEASADGTRAAYRQLIEDTGGDDAVVVYYSGHGARVRNAMRSRDASLPPWLQYVVPTDIDDRSGGRFGGLLAEELSALQWQLTERTPNVTTILDCCHSSRMSRNPGIVPRADARIGFPWEAVAASWAASRGHAGPGDANVTAVQVVACEPDQSAYEVAASSIGGTHGALTDALVGVLRRPDAATLSWTEVMQVVRPTVLDAVTGQRPDLLGTQSARNRVLFTLEEKDTVGVLPIAFDGGQAWLNGAGLFGMAEGDRYAVVGPGGDVEHAVATATVDGVQGDRARLHLDGATAAELPDGALAHPVEVSLGRRPVAVLPAGHRDAPAVLEVLRRSTHVRAVDDARGAMATVQLADDGMVLLDGGGAALGDEPRPVGPSGLERLDDQLRTLARATHVRDLAPGDGSLRGEVEVAYSRLDPRSRQEIALVNGEHVFVGDALVVRARNRSAATRYVSVLDVGLSGAVAIITRAQPSGTTVAAGEELVVGEDAGHALTGIELFWPDGLPDAGGPRPEALITIVADAPIDGLGQLEQAGLDARVRSATGRSAIERLIDAVSAGRRDARPPAADAPTVRYCVHRLDLLLHPTRRPDSLSEPAFAVDERPDSSFRLVSPAPAADAPTAITVRLAELAADGQARVDVLVAPPVRATTIVIGDGPPPLPAEPLFAGPVHGDVELAMWRSPADAPATPLAELLADAPSDDVAALIAHAAAELGRLTGDTVGAYRTTLLAHERFGADRPARRHPTSGAIAAGSLSIAYEVTEEVADG